MNISKFLLLPAASALITDQFLKYRTEQHSADFFPHPLMQGKIFWERHHNYGLAMNRADRHPRAVTAAVTAVFTVLGALLMPECLSAEKESDPTGLVFGFVLILSGGLSNLWDRFTRGYVVDYIRFSWKKIRHIILNIGDLCLFLGSLILILSELVSAFHSNRRDHI